MIDWNKLFELMYNNAVATFFFLWAISMIVGAANPFKRSCDCDCESGAKEGRVLD